jgi:hypothetical protein
LPAGLSFFVFVARVRLAFTITFHETIVFEQIGRDEP